MSHWQFRTQEELKAGVGGVVRGWCERCQHVVAISSHAVYGHQEKDCFGDEVRAMAAGEAPDSAVDAQRTVQKQLRQELTGEQRTLVEALSGDDVDWLGEQLALIRDAGRE